jgi:hypothetical protein
MFADMGQGLGAGVDVKRLHGLYFFKPEMEMFQRK